MTKFAPANDAGEKPYIVTGWFWGKRQDELIYASSPTEARRGSSCYPATNYQYVTASRRATPEDVEACRSTTKDVNA